MHIAVIEVGFTHTTPQPSLIAGVEYGLEHGME